MHRTIPANGRSVEDFSGQSETGDFSEALRNATHKARLTLAADSIEWRLLHVGGVATAASTTVVATIKAKANG